MNTDRGEVLILLPFYSIQNANSPLFAVNIKHSEKFFTGCVYFFAYTAYTNTQWYLARCPKPIQNFSWTILFPQIAG
jgi:uncharacterized protein with NRDE domain